MTANYTRQDQAAWARIIAESLRLSNPKVTDMSRLRRACRPVLVLPEGWRDIPASENPFVRMIRRGRIMVGRVTDDRDGQMNDAWTCFGHMRGRDGNTPPLPNGVFTGALLDDIERELTGRAPVVILSKPERPAAPLRRRDIYG